MSEQEFEEFSIIENYSLSKKLIIYWYSTTHTIYTPNLTGFGKDLFDSAYSYSIPIIEEKGNYYGLVTM